MEGFNVLPAIVLFVGMSQGDLRPGDVIINEIMQNPAAVADVDGEWFEVFNRTNEAIDMGGWTIRDRDHDCHVIDGSLSVPPRGCIVLGRNADSTANGGYRCHYQYGDLSLANGSDEIFLVAETTVIDSVVYDGGTSFPAPVGSSMELKNPDYDNDLGFNWGEAESIFGLGDGGTPGWRNSIWESSVEDDETPQMVPFALFENHPNPFNAATKIRYALSRNCRVKVEVYNLLGQRIELLVDSFQVAGYHTIPWDGEATSGIYLCRMEAGGFTAIRRMVLVK